MTTLPLPVSRRRHVSLACLRWLGCLAMCALPILRAAPTVVSVQPARNATGVATDAPLVFQFSEAMDESNATVLVLNGFMPVLTPEGTWSAGSTVLTIQPASWPANATLLWFLEATSAGGDPLQIVNENPLFPGFESGQFSTGTAGGGGTGTNSVTSYSVLHFHNYVQTSSAAPALDTEAPYVFLGQTALASNRTSTGVTLLLPTAQTVVCGQLPFFPELYMFQDSTNDLAKFNATYPQGSYRFTNRGTPSDQIVDLTASAPAQQPNAPQVSNFDAAQRVDPTQAFTLSWAPFQGGTAADYIWVEVGDDFETPDPDQVGHLTGAATSVVIPANTLKPSTDHPTRIYFARATFGTNAAGKYVTSSGRATVTEFSLKTTSGVPSTPPVVQPPVLQGNGTVAFQVQAAVGQSVTVESSTTLAAGSWTTVTNSTSGNITVTVTPSPANPRVFYRARTP